MENLKGAPVVTLYNTASRRKEAFVPRDPDHITMYGCGPTVYDRVHLGNGRAFVVFDVLYRLLSKVYPRVTYARNITDIDDKIIKASQAEGVSIAHLTEKMNQYFQKDMEALGVLPPTYQPKATEHLAEMVTMVKTLIEKGVAYEAQGHVFFDIRKDPSYGSLSRMPLDQMQQGDRAEVLSEKRSPQDFVLWKPSEAGMVGWESPWGFGRPGWHIECSAMSHHYLGTPFDIHCGGKDLVFPHHENEQAQSCCAFQTSSMANYWVHNEFLLVDHQKMSKSLGNFITLAQALKEHGGEVVRWSLLSAHYRQPLDWWGHVVDQAKKKVSDLYGVLGLAEPETPLPQGDLDPWVLEPLFYDLNTPESLRRLGAQGEKLRKAWKGGKKDHQELSQFRRTAQWLGFLQVPYGEWEARSVQDSGKGLLEKATIESWVEKRQEARRRKDFAEADQIRDTLKEHGISLEDRGDGTQWQGPHK